jgi:hypothetical protein
MSEIPRSGREAASEYAQSADHPEIARDIGAALSPVIIQRQGELKHSENATVSELVNSEQHLDIPAAIASAERIATLRAELSAATPEQEAKIHDWAAAYKENILTTYGHLMSDVTIQRAADLENRIVMTSDEQLAVRNEPVSTVDSNIPPDKSLQHQLYDEGILSFAHDPLVLEKMSESLRSSVIAANGGEAEARTAVNDMFMHYNVHCKTMLHFQDPSLPTVFGKAIAKGYASVNRQPDVAPNIRYFNHDYKTVYECAVEDFGDDVHRVFFGQEIDSERAEKIIQTVIDHAAEFEIGTTADVERVALQQNVQYDDLRIEASEILPQTQTQLRQAVAAAKHYLLQEVGPYISEDKWQKTAGLEDQIIVLDEERFDAFYSEWTQDGKQNTAFAQGATFPDLGGIAVKNPSHAWNDLPDEYKVDISLFAGDRERGRTAFCEIDMLATVLHETVHNFHDKTLPALIAELGVCYFEEKLSVHLFPTERGFMRAAGDIPYKNALDHFGDDVHRVFFGQEVQSEQKAAIIQFIRDEAAKDPIGHIVMTGIEEFYA